MICIVPVICYLTHSEIIKQNKIIASFDHVKFTRCTLRELLIITGEKDFYDFILLVTFQ